MGTGSCGRIEDKTDGQVEIRDWRAMVLGNMDTRIDKSYNRSSIGEKNDKEPRVKPSNS